MDGLKKVAERLKAARSLAGYNNRRDFCTHFGLPYDTIDAWERGKNPLTLKGAKRIIDSLKSVGIYCSEEWLIEGTGVSPRSFQEAFPMINLNPSESLSVFEEHLGLAAELSTFTTLNRNSILTLIRDDSMLPFYAEGDYVGGIRLPKGDQEEALHKRCIVEFPENSIAVGQFEKVNGNYRVSPLNKDAQTEIIEDVPPMNIVSVAPIVWHRIFPHE